MHWGVKHFEEIRVWSCPRSVHSRGRSTVRLQGYRWCCLWKAISRPRSAKVWRVYWRRRIGRPGLGAPRIHAWKIKRERGVH